MFMRRLNPSIPYADHPTNDVLEEYLLGSLPEHDLEALEAHVLACDACVVRLELLDTDVSAIKLALRDLSNQDSSKWRPYAISVWNRLSPPPLAWATIAASLVLCASLPRIAQHRAARPEVALHAYRGSEVTVVPIHQSAILAADAIGLPSDKFSVQVVNPDGREIWTGWTSVRNNRANVALPALNAGTYLLRFYGRVSSSTNAALLREFAFEVR